MSTHGDEIVFTSTYFDEISIEKIRRPVAELQENLISSELHHIALKYHR